MKKHLSLFLPLLALIFTLAPHSAWAQVNEYLTLYSNNIAVTFTGTPNVNLYYSVDKSTWNPVEEAGTIYSGNNSKTYYFKGNNKLNGFCKDANNYVTFVLNGGTISGNVMSLVNSTNDNPTEFITNSTIPTDYCFYSLFRNNTSTNNLNASALSLPAEYLTDYCYAYMFRSCTGLSQVPALPSTNLAPYCYAHMFEDCQNALFKTLPALPAVELEEGCYSYMFNLCPSLTNSDWYILPAEELAPYCYYQMFGLTMPNGNSTKSGKCTTLQKVEIMATSLQDRYGNDITNCMARMFNYMTVATTNTAYYGRGGLTLRFYWTNWGNGTTAASTATSTAPTCDWFTGLMSSNCTFQYQTGLNITATASDNTSSTKAHTFPKSSTLTAQSYTYLTFNCAANGGTWEEGSSYNTDLRRVVRADYTAKTIPAPPVKANHRFIGWFTTANDNEEDGSMLTEEYLKTITTATTVYARFVNDNAYTFTYINPAEATLSVTDNNNNSDYTAGKTYIFTAETKPDNFTLSYSNVTTGFFFDRWTGGNFTGNTVTFGTKKDLVVSAEFVEPDYFTITNTYTSNTTINMRRSNSSAPKPTLFVRIYNANGTLDTDWTQKDVTSGTSSNTSLGSIPAGGKMQIRGSGVLGSLNGTTLYYTRFYSISNSFEVSGNILSLVASSTETYRINDEYGLDAACLNHLFYNCTGLTNAENLKLPSTTVSSYAYANMFEGCTKLTKGPKYLPATTLSANCYQAMFLNCSTMVSGPERLPAEVMPPLCYQQMFDACKALTTAPEIDGTSMSSGNNQQCQYMFRNCSTLVKAPSKLKVTSLKTSCYDNMFNNCIKLEKGPDIYATVYESNSLKNMFDGCSSLNQIRTYGTSWGYSNYWIRNVQTEGVVYCPPTLPLEYGTTYNKMPKSSSDPWTVYSYDVAFIVKSGGLWADNTSANKHYIWSENDVDVVNKFLDDEAEVYTKFYTDNSYEHSKLISIADIKEALSRKQGETYTPKTYYAVKAAATYSLEWDENGGSALTGTYTSGDVAPGATITAPAEPTKSGYAFMGWKDQFGDDFTGTMPAEDVTYTAQWERAFTITATCNDGTVSLTAEGYTEKTGSGSYLEGTDLTMTVVPDDGYRFVRWTDNNTDNPRHITVSAAASYTAEVEVIPTHYARFYDEDGITLKYSVEVREGSTPVYEGPTLTKRWHLFDHWTPALTAMGTSDVAYTAVYVPEPYFTITNKHETSSTSVSLKRVSSSSPKTTLYFRIIDKDGNIISNGSNGWESKTMTSYGSTANSIGSIPAGGMMQLFGSNSTCFCSSTAYGNYSTFIISGGTNELSGNLLSLVACSDGVTVDNDFALTDFAFRGLFSGCTTVVSAENLELPSTTLSYRTYYGFFSGCTNLEKAPKVLPATTMTRGCYYQMFKDCSKLTKSPDIYGQTFSGTQNSSENGSMGSMFSGCTQLSSIRVYLTTQFSSSSYTTGYWVSNVQTTAGSFYCPRTLNRTQGGTYCIPSNWDIYSYDVTFVPVGGNWKDGTNTYRHFTWRTDVSDVNDFMTEQGDRALGYYRNSNLSNEITDMKALLTTQPSDDNTTYIYVEIGASGNDVTLKANGGTGNDQVVSAANGSPMPTTLKDGETAISAPTAPAGYKFGGYYDTNESSGGTQYYTAALASARNWDKSSATNLFARWIQKSYKLNLTSGGNGTVTRNDNGDSETVKHYNETVTLTPSESAGYHFYSWSGNGAAYVSNNVFTVPDGEDNTTYNVQAVFAPNTNTAYTVKHYKQNIDCSTYPDSPFETDNLNGTTATNVTPAVKSYEGFTAPSTQTISILADGSRVVEYYYTRNTYTVTVNVNTTGYGTVRAGSGEEQNSLTVASVPYGTVITTSTNTINVNGTTVTATKTADNAQYTYTFDGWTNGTVTVTDDMTVTANFSQTTRSYAVTFGAAANGSVSGKVKSPESSIMSGNTQQYGTVLTFTANPDAGYETDYWTNNGVKIASSDGLSSIDYTVGTTNSIQVVFKQKTYTVNVVSDNTDYGTVDFASVANVPHGTVITTSDNTVTINNTTITATPTTATEQYSYAFTGWTNGTATVTDDMTVSAIFSRTTNTYTVTWKNGDEVLETDENVAYGTTPSYGGETPTKDATAQYTYKFNGWDSEVVAVTGAVTYTATFSETLRSYTITFQNEDGTNLQSGSVNYGVTPEYTGETPTKTADAEHTYTFTGWDPAITSVMGEATYTATYSASASTYTIRFLDEDGTVLQSGSVAYGTTPEYTGDAPTKASDLIYSYTFSGWDKEITAVDGNKDYKAVYTPTDLADFDLVDDKNKNDDYYDVLSALVGKKRNVTYKRTMSPGQWNVVSLPFDFSLITNQGHPFNGNIYEMTGATYNDGYLDFNFMPMTTVMKANKPYIFYFYGNENKSDVRFENVKIKPLAEYDDSEDNVKVTVNVTGGTIKFRNTTYRENIYDSDEKERKRRVFINGTNLRYPNNPNIWIRAFRGYFYLGIGDEYITYIQPRLHIINGGQVTTLLVGAEQDNGTEVKKYIERGILVIERNGVKYNAQGARME